MQRLGFHLAVIERNSPVLYSEDEDITSELGDKLESEVFSPLSGQSSNGFMEDSKDPSTLEVTRTADPSQW